ncbi:hypothetical protein ACFOWC_10820 [Pedobacter mendelii]
MWMCRGSFNEERYLLILEKLKLSEMKKLLILFCTLSIFTTCKKDTVDGDKLFGRWELISTTEGLSGKTTTYASGQGNILTLTDNAYTETRSNIVIREGKYSTIRKESMLTKQKEDFLIYENSGGNTFFTIADGKLSLNLDAFDSGGYSYKRVK